MKRLLVLGAGTAGTMVVNRLRRRLDDDWQITIIDRDNRHDYQPGYLFLPFGTYQADDVSKPRDSFIPKGVRLFHADIELVDTDRQVVHVDNGAEFPYDQLIIASGTSPRPDQTPGMDGDLWHKDVFDFYTLEGSLALAKKLEDWEGGKLVVHITEMPIKCPVAPLEFAFLAESHFRAKGMADKVDITYVTPLDGAFTKPVASNVLATMLEDRDIHLEPDFVIERVDNDAKTIVSYDERAIPFDLLVTIPLNMGADFVARSGLGDDLNYVPVDKHTFLADGHDNIWALGDASNIPTSKAGSVAHFSVELFEDNFLEHIAGKPMTHPFDGHANCFVEAGDGKALLLDFNYDTQPLPGNYPLAHLGPMRLLEETELNHWGKLAFRPVYWSGLLKGRPLPIPPLMSMSGKHDPTTDKTPQEATR